MTAARSVLTSVRCASAAATEVTGGGTSTWSTTWTVARNVPLANGDTRREADVIQEMGRVMDYSAWCTRDLPSGSACPNTRTAAVSQLSSVTI